MQIHRALNQKTARHLSFVDFLDLAKDLACVGVEPRNDLGRPFFDGIAPAEAGKMALDRGLRLLGMCEVYAFNDWNDDRAAAVEDLIATAVASGAETISLIPSVEPGRRTVPLRDVLQEIRPMLQGTGVVALIEPLGFVHCSLADKAMVIEAIAAAGARDLFKIVHDTFQHVIGGGGPIFPNHTATVHISGISDPHPALDESLDGHRVLIDEGDRCDNVGQIRAFLDAGYEGAFSFECTEPSVQDSLTLAEDIAASFAYVEHVLKRG